MHFTSATSMSMQTKLRNVCAYKLTHFYATSDFCKFAFSFTFWSLSINCKFINLIYLSIFQYFACNVFLTTLFVGQQLQLLPLTGNTKKKTRNAKATNQIKTSKSSTTVNTQFNTCPCDKVSIQKKILKNIEKSTNT